MTDPLTFDSSAPRGQNPGMATTLPLTILMLALPLYVVGVSIPVLGIGVSIAVMLAATMG